MNRGSGLHPLVPHDLQAASMRPRFMNRGSHGRASQGRGIHAASMRPRFMNRGSRPPERELIYSYIRLQ